MAREKIAKERIEYLYKLAKEKLEEHPEDSRKYIEMLRKLSTKHNLKITELKKKFCKECSTLLIPGTTSSVRIHNNRRVITCKNCGTIKRLGINKET